MTLMTLSFLPTPLLDLKACMTGNVSLEFYHLKLTLKEYNIKPGFAELDFGFPVLDQK